MTRMALLCAAVLLIQTSVAFAQEEKNKEVISFSGSGDGPIKTVEKDGSVSETDASTLNNINVIPGFSGPSYIFDEDDEPGGETARTGSARTSTQGSARSNGDKQGQSARIDEMLKNRKRHLRRDSDSRPPVKRRD